MAYKIIINDRDYSSWTIHDSVTLDLILDLNPNLNPKLNENMSHNQTHNLDIKLFNPAAHFLITGDVFDLTADGQVKICYSPVRSNEFIPGVLVIASNKTYGKYKGRLLYKCIPDDIRLPAFLVPYEIKHVGFSKVFTNLYVTFRVESWTFMPLGILSQTIGPIDVLNNYYEYQLYCKSLNSSIQQFNNAAKKAVNLDVDSGSGSGSGSNSGSDSFILNMCKQFPSIEDRTCVKNIFTIDPANSGDLDDAFSIHSLPSGDTLVSIYIANVTIWMDFLNLWSSFSQRISTIYLPDKKRPMLPTVLSDCLCSLLAATTRVALVMDIIISSTETGACEIESVRFSNCIIRVAKNYVYEEAALLKNADYLKLFNVCQLMSKKYKYITSVRNSHDIVTYLMILMNYYSAQELLKHKVGIFRCSSTSVTSGGTTDFITDSSHLDPEVAKFITIWNSSSGQYVNIETDSDSNSESGLNLDLIKHSVLNLDAYVHITSPIRRLVDLLNIIQLQRVLHLVTLSETSLHFYTNWTEKLDYINVTMRAIKRIQNDCTLLDTCQKDPKVLERVYDGFCFDKIIRGDGLYQFVVYLPELKMVSRVTIRENMANYEKRQYKLLVFNNEAKFKKKIRLSLV
jgi:exoribonuclease R